MKKIYKLAVYVEGQEKPSFNGLRFSTAEEANDYGKDLASRWYLVTKYHPVLDVSETKTEIKWTSYLATAYAEGFCEGEGASEDEQTQAWQYLIDTGLCWQLQGWFGRTASNLIESGICKARAGQ